MTRAPGETMSVAQYKAAAAKAMSESEFQQRVIVLAHAHGWRVAAFRKVRVQRKNGSVYYETPVQADGKGWPDLALVRGERLIFAELKVGYNKPEPEQAQWLSDLTRAAEVYVWKPKDMDEIESVLA